MFRSALNAVLIAMIVLVVGFSFTQTFAEHPEGDQAKTAHKQKTEKQAKAPRVYGDFAKLELTDDQKAQIAAIHTDILAKRKALEQEEEARSLAVLTDAQKEQLAKMREEDAAKRKAEAKERYEKMKAKRGAEKSDKSDKGDDKAGDDAGQGEQN